LEEKANNNVKLKVIFSIVIIALLAVIGVLVYKLTHIPEPEAQVAQETAAPAPEGNLFDYDNAAVAIDEDSLLRALQDMADKVQDGQINLQMRTTARSNDGVNFSCKLANSPENRYDLFLTLYLDETGEEIYKSGLIPLGMEISNFQTNRKIEKGNHEATLVYTQVNDDKATVHATANVGLTLVVEGE
jgi:hypothetical protein